MWQAILVGEACANRHTDMKVNKPLDKGCVQDWEGLTALLDAAFSQSASVMAASQKALLTEAPLTGIHERQRLLEILFERHSFAAALTQLQAALTLYSQGTFQPENLFVRWPACQHSVACCSQLQLYQYVRMLARKAPGASK